ncbi:MAG TPA: hypothetical protein VGI23_10675 [Steroidobacteraceae bacterium]|jgi:hypothetical protein
MKILGLAAVAIVLCSGALAQEPATPETVTIEAQRQRQLIENQISTFVTAITMPNREEALLRWHRPVCPAIVGLTKAQGEFMLARLSQAVIDTKAPLAPEDCAPNFVVVATQHPEALLQTWWDQNPRLFNSDKGIGGIKHFLAGKTPIRAWYNAELGCEEGASRVRGGKTYTPTHCAGGMISGGSRLTYVEVRAITSVIVVVDLEKAPELTIGQVTDYATLIGLAQIREDADPGPAPTILHLFANSGGALPDGLSSWDREFLKALYDTNVDGVMQVSQIKVRLYQDLAR